MSSKGAAGVIVVFKDDDSQDTLLINAGEVCLNGSLKLVLS